MTVIGGHVAYRAGNGDHAPRHGRRRLRSFAYVFAAAAPCPRCSCPNYFRLNYEARAVASRCCRTGAGTPSWAPPFYLPLITRYFAAVAALSDLFAVRVEALSRLRPVITLTALAF